MMSYNSWYFRYAIILVSVLRSCISQTEAPLKLDTSIDFINAAADVINKLRDYHQVGPLTINMTLCADSEAWAKKIGAQSEKVGLPKAYYSRVKEFGENVWASDKYPADVNASIPIMAWYDQVQMFNWSNNIFNFSTAQFTMLIWKSTKEFGIAKYITPSKKYVMVVARFHPQGNWNYYKDFAENVFPPRSLNSSRPAESTSVAPSPPSTTTPNPSPAGSTPTSTPHPAPNPPPAATPLSSTTTPYPSPARSTPSASSAFNHAPIKASQAVNAPKALLPSASNPSPYTPSAGKAPTTSFHPDPSRNSLSAAEIAWLASSNSATAGSKSLKPSKKPAKINHMFFDDPGTRDINAMGRTLTADN